MTSGSSLGRYELLVPIAKGGMAQVWAARLHGTRGFQKIVAIKTILAGTIDNTRMEEMFLEEAHLASQIHHSNVVATTDLGEHAGTLYLVMEWVDGEPLGYIMSKSTASGGVPLAIGVNLIGQACKGLYAAHTLKDGNGAPFGLVHRDVSPQNLLITYSGTAKLVDFGIAKATSKVSSLTEAGEIKGKFSYMAPEQVRGQALDARTDLFALGILLYQITTGKHPFRGDNPAETLQNICSDKPPARPSSVLPDYPAALEVVVMKALEKDPAKRFSSANDLLTALERAMPGPLEASFEVQVAEYLKQLLGTRASERRAALKVAQEYLDRKRAESSSSAISVGTLRAIAIDQNDQISLTPSKWSAPSLASTQASEGMPPRAVLPKRAVIATGVVLALAVAGLGLKFAASRDASGGAQAASPVPAQSLAAVSGVLNGAAAPVVSATHAAQPAESAEAAATASKNEKRGTPEKGAHGTRLRVGVKPLASAALAAPTSTQAAPPAVPVPTATDSTNAWNRGAFGGRH